jgi:hypothetical protein
VCDVDADAILASAAIPTLFEATRITDRSGEHVYWDALFSQNPPVRDFVSVQRDLGEEPPDEIWVIQINPQRSGREPKQIGEILDRRNELTGNLSLNQELGFIKSMNKWLLDKDKVSPEWFTPVWIHRIELIMERDGHDALDLASKLDRSAAHVDQLMDAGKRAAAGFLEQWRARSAPFEVLPLTVRRLTGEQLRALKEDWTCLRSKAGDQPAREVVTEAGKLVQRAMRERGYPVADFFDRLSDICATDQEVATQYPPTMEMVLRARDGLASGDELHEGWQRCEALLRHLLDPAQPPRPVFPEAPRTVRAARTSAGASALQRLAQRVAGVVL